MPDNKNLVLPAELKDSIRDQAWRRRTSMGELVREVIADYAAGNLSLPTEGTFDAAMAAEIKYTAPPEYPAALERARSEGRSLAEVVRYGLLQRTK